jgi:glycosidase
MKINKFYKYKKFKYLLMLTFACIVVTQLLIGCAGSTPEYSEIQVEFLPPEWAVNANLYQVNIRQYTPEGTFSAFAEDIPRLQEMGVRILWFMPIHPIGVINRKGTLGSYYSIRDYLDVNPEFGDKDDFRFMVNKAKEHGMRVIIDWVANHTAWDAVWTQTNPEYYMTDENGNFYSPVDDWSDVIQLDVHNRDMWDEMITAMKYWVREYDIDGFRADVAYMLPVDFWITARSNIEEIKPVFMLAEAEDPDLHRAFNMTYAWDYAQTIRDMGAGNASTTDLDEALNLNFDRFEKKDYRMFFTTNHDENSWNGSDPEIYSANFKNFAVLSATVWGMPLIYNGQESILDKQLEFFEKDEIEWDDYPDQDFYSVLLDLNTRNQALFNGEIGGNFKKMPTDNDENIFAYKRIGHHEQVMAILNFSDHEETFSFKDGHTAIWNNVFSGEEFEINDENVIGPNHFFLLERIYMSH